MPVSTVAAALHGGAVVGFPTETVYGIGASIRQPAAIAELFRLTERPPGKPILLHVRDHSALDAFAAGVPDSARMLAEAFWPGPLTLVLRRAESVDPIAVGGSATVGLRAPAHPLALDLLDALGRLDGGVPAIAGTSANRSGHTPPVTADLARQQLPPEVVHLLDGGPCRVGIESTVLSLVGEPSILRSGAVPRRHIEAVLGAAVRQAEAGGSPPPTLHVLAFEAGTIPELATDRDAVIALGDAPVGAPGQWRSGGQTTQEYARGLFALLAACEAQGYARVFLARVPDDRGTGLSEAVNARIDRLTGDS